MINQGDIQISRVHSAALCREISERLDICLGKKPVGVPPHLMALVRQFRDEPVDPNPLKTFLAWVPTQDKSPRRKSHVEPPGEAN
jgi:hypothetical protein